MQRAFFGEDAGHNFRTPLALERNSLTQVFGQLVSLLENDHSTRSVPGHLEHSPLYLGQVDRPTLVRSTEKETSRTGLDYNVADFISENHHYDEHSNST